MGHRRFWQTPLPKIHRKVPLYPIADVCYIADTKLLSGALTVHLELSVDGNGTKPKREPERNARL